MPPALSSMNFSGETEDIICVSGKRIRMRPHNPQDALAISQQLGVPDLIGRILAGRGVQPQAAAGYLNPTLREHLPNPLHLNDMEKAAKRVAEAIEQKESIAVFGDYDVDGATSSALLVRYFRTLGLMPLIHIPDRMKEGYGPNTPALLALAGKGASVIITVDCGTMAFEPLAAAKNAGVDVIVVDHHKGEAQLPEAYAVVNPNRADETSAHTYLAAVGVTFLLLVAVNSRLKALGRQIPDLMQFLDLVALGSICDVVPLVGANRALVTQGLKIMRARGNPGITAIMDMVQLAEPPGTYHAGFIIGPRINASGRVGKSDLGTHLLSTDDPWEAAGFARELHQFNAERKAIESLVQEEAMEAAAKLDAGDAIILVARKGWHAGVIGIVAGRLKEYLGKPAIVIALDDNGVGKASARSVAGIDIGAAVIAAVQEKIVLSGGGHAMAAGFSIHAREISALRDFLNLRLAGNGGIEGNIRSISVDGVISLSGVTVKLAHLIEQAGPYGAGNPHVRLWIPNLRVVNASIVGDGHVRAILTDISAGVPSGGVKAMAFRSAGTPLGEALLNARGRAFHVAGSARVNVWQGKESVDFFIDDAAFT